MQYQLIGRASGMIAKAKQGWPWSVLGWETIPQIAHDMASTSSTVGSTYLVMHLKETKDT